MKRISHLLNDIKSMSSSRSSRQFRSESFLEQQDISMKILFIGIPHSGKSTIVKQIQILHGLGYIKIKSYIFYIFIYIFKSTFMFNIHKHVFKSLYIFKSTFMLIVHKHVFKSLYIYILKIKLM